MDIYFLVSWINTLEYNGWVIMVMVGTVPWNAFPWVLSLSSFPGSFPGLINTVLDPVWISEVISLLLSFL